MRLFISYAHVDKAIVKDWVVSKLVAGGHDVWFDDRLIAGQDWKQQLSDEIERSDALVYCMTPESVASDWCQWELARAVDLGKPVIPVLMQARTQLPDQLKKLQYVDFSDGPTGDAVARLMGGLQNLSPAQIPPAPADPKGKPAQATKQEGEQEQEKAASANIVMKLLRDPAIQAIIGIMSLVLAVIAIAITQNGGSDPPPTQQPEPPTPATPIVVALRDLEIRDGPGANFSRLNILPVNGSLDILGISDDRLWYQILLQDGSTGWILAASSGARLEGDRGVVSVIVPTLTPSNTPTRINTLTNTPTAPTSTPSPTDTPTKTHTPTDTDTPPLPTITNTPTVTATNTQTPTNTAAPTVTPTQTDSPTSTTAPSDTPQPPTDNSITPAEAPETTIAPPEQLQAVSRSIQNMVGVSVRMIVLSSCSFEDCLPSLIYVDPDPISFRQYSMFANWCDNNPQSPLCGFNAEQIVTKDDVLSLNNSPDDPIINITWFQARNYCLWRGARLPTIEEWQHIANRFANASNGDSTMRDGDLMEWTETTSGNTYDTRSPHNLRDADFQLGVGEAATNSTSYFRSDLQLPNLTFRCVSE